MKLKLCFSTLFLLCMAMCFSQPSKLSVKTGVQPVLTNIKPIKATVKMNLGLPTYEHKSEIGNGFSFDNLIKRLPKYGREYSNFLSKKVTEQKIF